MTLKGDDTVDEQVQSIVRYEGVPNDVLRAREPRNWRRFLAGLFFWTKGAKGLAGKSVDLGRALAEAEVAKQNGEARVRAETAATLAAEADVKRASKVRMVNDEIARIFSEPNALMTKHLQLASLLSEFPELKEGLAEVLEIVEDLSVRFGAKVEFVKPALATDSDEHIELQGEALQGMDGQVILKISEDEDEGSDELLGSED